MASHEFRTPLTVIQNAADLLRLYSDRLTPSEREGWTVKINAEVRHMTELLDGVLMLGRADAGKFAFHPIPLDLGAFCADLAREAELTADPPHQVRLSYRGPSGMLAMDPTLLRHIIGNLLSNGIKFSPPDRPVLFDVTADDQQIRIRISDSGIGIPEADRPALFEPFHRGANVDTIAGTGLGLTVVKQAVDLHRGTIQIESQAGSGTSVTVTLPRVEDD
jgi:signal transduction histidine kinase